MATDELLPPACAFAVSVLTESGLDPDAVPEEAVEAAQQHMATCVRCRNDSSSRQHSGTAREAPTSHIDTSTPVLNTPTRKKKKARRPIEQDYTSANYSQPPLYETPPHTVSPVPDRADETIRGEESSQRSRQAPLPPNQSTSAPTGTSARVAPRQGAGRASDQSPTSMTLPDGPLDCLQCRQVLRDYAEAMDNGENMALLYPEVQEHLLGCESGCLVLLELFRQEVKANRKYHRRPVRNPFSAIGWEITGFFRGGQVPMSPMALSYGTLLLLLFVALLSTFLAVRWDDARYYRPPLEHTLPTPDGVGFSDGLKIYDACNAGSYTYKRQAAQAMQQGNLSRADSLLASAINVVGTDTTGCNGAEAAIYREDLHVRQSGRPFGIVVVSFDSGPGNADPQGGTDRHILYAAYTQELVGAFIGQQQYNSAQMQIPGAPLLYLVLANTTGVEQGTLQIADSIASMASSRNLKQFGLLASSPSPLLSVLGLGPGSLAQVVLPALCRAGVPLIAPTATDVFIINLLSSTSLYRHCTPGFAFIRFSPDDATQSILAASYAYNSLRVRNVVIYYDPSNPSSKESAQVFMSNFSGHKHTRILAQETAVASGLLDGNGRPQASQEDLLTGLRDALTAKPQPDLLFAPLLTNDVITLAQAIARLPQKSQPILMIGGEFVQPSALQGLVQWARQQQLILPHIFVSLTAVARPPTDGDWQKQFYASFCTSFAIPGNFCSGATALDQGALLFGDGVEMIAKGVGPITTASQFPTAAQLVLRISKEKFAGVSCPISLRFWDNMLVTSTKARPVMLSIQEDGSISVVG